MISKSSDIGHMLTIADFGLFLDVSLELCITVTIEQPLEDNFLHLLVVRLLKEVIMETSLSPCRHWIHDEELSFARTFVEGTKRAVSGEADQAAQKDGHSWFVNDQR